MKKFLFGLAALPFLAGVAMAGQPTPLSDAQMDKVSAGQIEYNTPGAEFMFGLVFEPGLSSRITIQTPGADPHAFCSGCTPSNFEPTQPTLELIAVPGFGIFRGS
jgi:hypothetical protein